MSVNYDIEYAPLYEVLQTIDVRALADSVDVPWWNRTLLQVGDVLVRLGIMHGEFHWHRHDEQDEFFLVLDGQLRIELENADAAELGPWQAFSVPAGMMHRPVAPNRAVVVMIERAGIIATGD